MRTRPLIAAQARPLIRALLSLQRDHSRFVRGLAGKTPPSYTAFQEFNIVMKATELRLQLLESLVYGLNIQFWHGKKIPKRRDRR